MSIDEIFERGSMIGCFEEWELWDVDGHEYAVNVLTGAVIPQDEW